MGYSFGALVAIECARLLEALGKRGHVVSVDGSPSYTRKIVEKFVGSKDPTNEKIQLELLSHAMQAITSEESLDNIRMKIEPIESKWDKAVDLIKESKASIDGEYFKVIAKGVYNRILATLQYSARDIVKIKSPITLIRATEALVSDTDEDMELPKYTEGLFNMKFIDGTHQSIVEDPKLIDIINEISSVKRH